MRTMAIQFLKQGQVIDLRPSHVERLVTRLFMAFEVACESHDVESAQDILDAVQRIMTRTGLPVQADQDKSAQMLVDAHYRLWELRYLAR